MNVRRKIERIAIHKRRYSQSMLCMITVHSDKKKMQSKQKAARHSAISSGKLNFQRLSNEPERIEDPSANGADAGDNSITGFLKVSTKLPESLYSSTLLGPMLAPDNVCEKINHNIVLLFSHIFQFTLIYFIAKIDAEEGYECPVEQTESILTTICVILFICSINADIEESFRMLIYVIRLRKISVDTTHVDALEETAEDVRDPPKDAQGYARIIKSTMKRYLKGLAGRFEQYSAKDESFEINFFQFLEKAGGRSNKTLFKFNAGWSVCFVIIPKVLIALLLLYYGGLFISRSQTASEIILNAVALNFICEIDELMYNYFIPESLRLSKQKDLPEITVDMPQYKTQSLWLFYRFVYITGLLHAIRHFACHPNESFFSGTTGTVYWILLVTCFIGISCVVLWILFQEYLKRQTEK